MCRQEGNNKDIECVFCGKWLKLRSLRNHANEMHFEEFCIGTPLKDLWIERRTLNQFKIQKIDSITADLKKNGRFLCYIPILKNGWK